MRKTQDSIPREALAQAAKALGSRARLAERLRVPPGQLERWLKGEEPPPSSVVFAALALVEQDKSAP